VRDRGVLWFLGRLRVELAANAAWLFGGHEAREALREGAVRRSGEIHKWMYDRYSLTRLLRRAGFSEGQLHGPRKPDRGLRALRADVADGRVRRTRCLPRVSSREAALLLSRDIRGVLYERRIVASRAAQHRRRLAHAGAVERVGR
jgi:hypothetical protein